MTYIETLTEAAIKDGRPTQIFIKDNYFQIYVPGVTSNYDLRSICAKITKDAGFQVYTYGANGVYLNLPVQVRQEVLPNEYLVALDENIKAQTTYNQVNMEWQKKRKGAIANAQMLAAKKFDSDEGIPLVAAKLEAQKKAGEAAKTLSDVTPKILTEGVKYHLRD